MKWVLAILPAVMLACTPLEESDAPVEDAPKKPDQAFEEAVIELHEAGQLRAEIHAKFLDQYKRDQFVLLYENVRCIGYDSLGRMESLLSCDTLRYERVRGDLKAWSRVEVFGQDLEKGESVDFQPDFHLQTEWAMWTKRLQRLRTDAPVVFYTALDTLHGVGFSSNQNLKSWEIGKPTGVSHRVLEDDSQRENPVQMKSDQSETNEVDPL